VWRQILADVFGCPVQSLNFLEEATSMGAAVIGGVAAGVFSDFDVIHNFVRVEHTVIPNAENHKFYSSLMHTFEDTYRSLTPTYEALMRSNL
jgi:xylulokinase